MQPGVYDGQAIIMSYFLTLQFRSPCNPGYTMCKPLSQSIFSCHSLDLHATQGIRWASHYHNLFSHTTVQISMQPGVYDGQATVTIYFLTPQFGSPCNPGYTMGKPLSQSIFSRRSLDLHATQGIQWASHCHNLFSHATVWISMQPGVYDGQATVTIYFLTPQFGSPCNPGYTMGKPLSQSIFSRRSLDLHATRGIRWASHCHNLFSHATVWISMQPGVYDGQATVTIYFLMPQFRSPCNPGYTMGKPLSQSIFSRRSSDLHATRGIRWASHYHYLFSHAAVRISMQPRVYDGQATITIYFLTPQFRSPCNPGYTMGKPLSQPNFSRRSSDLHATRGIRWASHYHNLFSHTAVLLSMQLRIYDRQATIVSCFLRPQFGFL